MSIAHENLVARIFDHAATSGRTDAAALRQGDRVWTYAELMSEVARVSTVLATLRVGKGDRVAVYMPDCMEAAAAILGAIHRGAIAVPISELSRANDVRDTLNDCGAVLVVTHKTLQPTIDAIRAEASGVCEVLVVGGAAGTDRDFGAMVRGAAPASAPAAVAADDPALIFYSAGASVAALDGQPTRRGVAHSHATPVASFESFARSHLDLRDTDRVFSIARVSTSYGLSAGLLFPLLAGCEAIFLAEQPHSTAIFDLIDAHKPTVMFATPSVYGQLARDAEVDVRDGQLASIRACVSGAEDMPPRVVARVKSALGVEVQVGYGLTEAFQFVVCGAADSGRPGACGKPMPGFELRIIGDDDKEVGADEIGTLEIRGNTVAGTYWGASESSLDADGWFRTRDRFMRDDSGNYYHCGRVDHLFKVGGKWVSPAEVEHALLANEAVWECAVIGVEDEDGLIKPMAFVVPNIGHDASPDLAADLRTFIKQELAPYKYPRWIEFLDKLPKGPQGKVLRYKLRERAKAGKSQRRAETAGV